MINQNTSLFEFIKDKSFEEIKTKLFEKPFSIKCKEKDNLYLLKYSQIDSDFNYKITRQCRGIILEKNTNNIICYGFDKFGNYGESYVPNIDFNTATITEKVDGSLIRLYWYDNHWNIATNGTIDASDATVTDLKTDKEYSFKELFFDVMRIKNIDFKDLTNIMDPTHNYCFELVHPVSRVVILYEPNLYLIGARDMISLKESNIYDDCFNDLIKIGIKIPKVYYFSKLEDIIKIINELSNDEEGYVITDINFNRMKVKNPKYLAKHRLALNRNFSRKAIIECIVNGVDDDMSAYFPEIKEKIDKVKLELTNYMSVVKQDINTLFNKKYENKKEFALDAIKTILPSFAFAIYDDKMKIEDIEVNILKLRIKKIEELLIHYYS